ncbi:MAG: hypothetical protein EPN97_00975 [Alphaproteobacteria bacterium]|nr:MAG: hypothetical protein EPN97_00975 [Alphaproteobacteria bacterium]
MASIKKLAIAFTAAAAILGGTGLYTYNMAYKYSEGARTGTVFKLSEKGSLCKTWEGQMMTDGYGRVEGQGNTASFEFTVMDKDLLPKIKEAERTGERVELEYRQAKWTWSCLQESEYVATGINKVDGQGHSTPYILNVPAPRKK